MTRTRSTLPAIPKGCESSYRRPRVSAVSTRRARREWKTDRQLSVLQTTMGPPDRGERRHRRFRLGGSPGCHRSLPEGKQNTGATNSAGPIVTAGGLVFVGATADNRFRAFDSKTGKELWVTRLDYTATAVPMTFMGKNGKQYVAIVAATGGGGGRGGRGGAPAARNQGIFVFALP